MKKHSGKSPQHSTSPSVLAQPIRWFMLAAFIVVAAVPLGFLGMKLYDLAWDEAWREITEKHQLLAKNLAAPISIYVDDQRTALRLLGDFINYNAISDAGLTQNTQVRDAIRRSMSRLENFRSVNLLDLKGQILITTQGGLSQSEVGLFETETCFVNTRNNQRWSISATKRSPIDGLPTVVMSIPVNDQRGRLAAVLLGEMRLDKIEALRKKIKFGIKGHSAIVDHKGKALAHPNPEWVREMRDLSAWPIVQNMTSGQTGVTQFYSPFMGADMVAGYASVPGLNWGVMVPQPKPEVEAHVNRILHTQLMWGLAGLLMALMLAFLLTRWLTGPIKRLSRSAAEMVSDKLEGHLPEVSRHAPREVQELHGSFDNLVRDLQLSRIELRELNGSLQMRIKDATQELRGANRQLQIIASQDYLTRVYNRRYFESTLLHKLSSRAEHDAQICLMMIDIDNFKAINERYGHAGGDRVLVQLAAILQEVAGDKHLVARYAGDEFVLLIKGSFELGEVLGRALLQRISDTHFEWHGETIQTTVSIGMVSRIVTADLTLDSIMQNVDQALFTAKQEGRNRLAVNN